MWIRSIYASMARILPILTKEPSGGGSVGSGGQWARGAEWGNTRRGPILPRLLTHPFRIPAPSTLSQFIPSFAEHFFSPSPSLLSFWSCAETPKSAPLSNRVTGVPPGCCSQYSARSAHDPHAAFFTATRPTESDPLWCRPVAQFISSNVRLLTHCRK
jgi:hypothetical protein